MNHYFQHISFLQGFLKIIIGYFGVLVFRRLPPTPKGKYLRAIIIPKVRPFRGRGWFEQTPFLRFSTFLLFIRRPYLLFIVLSYASPLHSQTAEELLQEINQTTQLLDETQKTQAQVLDGYYALQHQLDRRAKLIKAIQREIKSTDVEVETSAMAVDALELEIEQLKAEYSTILRQAYRLKKSRNDLLFLFSATSFNQGLKRWRYLQQYKEYRKKQVQLILEKRATLNQKIQQLTDNKKRQEQLLEEEVNQTKIVREELDLKGTIVGQLKKEARSINRLLKEQRKAHQRLAQSVETTIASDLLNKEEPTKEMPITTSEKSKPKKNLSPTISYEFIKRKGKFIWPIHQGVIVRYFGNQPHPIHKKTWRFLYGLFQSRICTSKKRRNSAYPTSTWRGCYSIAKRTTRVTL